MDAPNPRYGINFTFVGSFELKKDKGKRFIKVPHIRPLCNNSAPPRLDLEVRIIDSAEAYLAFAKASLLWNGASYYPEPQPVELQVVGPLPKNNRTKRASIKLFHNGYLLHEEEFPVLLDSTDYSKKSRAKKRARSSTAQVFPQRTVSMFC